MLFRSVCRFPSCPPANVRPCRNVSVPAVSPNGNPRPSVSSRNFFVLPAVRQSQRAPLSNSGPAFLQKSANLFSNPFSINPHLSQNLWKLCLLFRLHFQLHYRAAEHPFRYTHCRPFRRTYPIIPEGMAGIIRPVHTLLNQFFACSFQAARLSANPFNAFTSSSSRKYSPG